MFTNIYLVRKKQSNPKMIMTIALAVAESICSVIPSPPFGYF